MSVCGENVHDQLPWWKGGLYFSCLGCGKCCRSEPGAVWVTDEEIATIAETLSLEPGEFKRRYMWKRYGKPSLKECPNYDCIFLDRSPDRCSIYNVRPSQCRSFPFWPEVLKNELAWDSYSLSCPGMNQGAFHSYDSILAQLSDPE